jgi:hypothetical protein
MKKLTTLLAAVLLTANIWAQSPQKMSYQAVIRDASNTLVTNTTVGMQISILQSTSTGTAVYVETQAPTTNANGLVSIEIGAGTAVSGTFSAIDWSAGPYFIKTETDPAGGTNYTITGISQLLSVPYALYAKIVEPFTGTIGDSYGGGIIFYVTPDGHHGLIAETQDQSTSSTWYKAQNEISKSSNHSVAGKNYTDWRLPTSNELYLLYLQRNTVGGYTSNFYWSSELDYYNAFEMNLGTGTSTSVGKSSTQYIRAVRSF